MDIKSRGKIKGKVDYVLRGPDGKIKAERHTPKNTITALHDVVVADRLSGGSDTLISHGKLGTSTGQTSASTDLATPVGGARTAIDSLTQGTGGDDNDAIIVCTFGAGVDTGTITEAGLFNHLSNATMQCYDDSLNVTKAAGDTLELTWTVSYGAS